MRKTLLLLLLPASLALAQSTSPQYLSAQSSSANGHFTQFDTDGQPAKLNPDSSKSHWRINTDPTSRSTTVQFFGLKQQMLYEEQLPGKYIPLNDRNVAQLDQLLTRLSTNNLVASEVKANPLLPESRFYKAHSSSAAPQLIALDASPQPVGPYTNLAYDVHHKKLVVRFDNPSGSRVNIKLSGEKDSELYWNSVVAPTILQRFDMSSAPNGRYTLTIYRPYNRERYVQKIQLRSGVPILVD